MFRVEARPRVPASGGCRISVAFGGRVMSWNDTEYFRRRAIVERNIAKTAADAKAAAIHHELADRYETLADARKRPALNAVT